MQVCEFASNLSLSAVLPSPVARNLPKQQVGLNVDHLILTRKRDLQVLVSDKECLRFSSTEAQSCQGKYVISAEEQTRASLGLR